MTEVEKTDYFQIAGLYIGMTLHGNNLTMAMPWKTDFQKDPDMVFPVLPGITDEKETLRDVREYIDTGSFFSHGLLDFEGFTLHASAIVFGGKAYCFAAKSGTGKSTHTRLWQETFGMENVLILNDDRPAIRKVNGVWTAFGTPWCGTSNIGMPAEAPLGGIIALFQNKENIMVRLESELAMFTLSAHSEVRLTGKQRLKLLKMHEDIVNNVPIWGLKCRPDRDAVMLAWDNLNGRERIR